MELELFLDLHASVSNLLQKCCVFITLSLNALRSSKVRESDLAMTGTTLTTSESFFKTTMSIGLSLIFT